MRYLLEGMASLMDGLASMFGAPVRLPKPKTEEEAIRETWKKVGGDMWRVLGREPPKY